MTKFKTLFSNLNFNFKTINLKLKTYIELSKVRITISVTLTTITGYVLAAGEFNTGLIIPTLGIFILACGSAALNHFQERKTDALMERTRNRPIPSGRISPNDALFFAIFLIVTGSGMILFGSNFLAFGLDYWQLYGTI